MVDGYVRRFQRLEDLLIINCALPAYRAAYGKKAPTYEQLTAHRKENGATKIGSIDEETEAYWRPILNGGIDYVEKSGNEIGNQKPER